MKFRFIYGITLTLFLFQFGNAQTISMDEFLESIKQTHPFFEKEFLTTEIERGKQEGFLGSQDWIISSSPYYAHQKMVSTSSFNPERVDMIGGDVGVQRAFWNTGGRLSLSWSSDFTDQDVSNIVIPFPTGDVIIPSGVSKFYQNKISVTYSQPLLQNFKGTLDRLNYELSDYAIDLSEIAVCENQEGFLLDLAIRFLDWFLLTEQKRIATERLNLANEMLRQVRRRRAANLVDRVDVLRAEDASRIAKQNIVLIESQWKAKQAELAVLAQSQKLYELSPVFDIYKLDTFPQQDDAVTQIKEKSLLLEMLKIQREQLSHLLGGYEEISKPQLFLNIGAGLTGGDEEFDRSLKLDNPDISVSLAFRFPLGNRIAKSDITETKLQFRQLDKEIENVTLDIEAAVRNILVQIKEMEEVLFLNKEQISSAKKKTFEENRMYNQGRGDLTFVIQSRDNEQNAKLTYAQNAAIYKKLILQYRALMDELLLSTVPEQK